MKKSLIIIVCALAVLGFIVKSSFSKKDVSQTEVNSGETKIHTGEPIFAWSYKAFDKDEIPHSIVSLTASYPDGTSETKEIDTIEGSCNEYVEPDKDVYAKSKMIICYYAGFGRYYKVVQSNGTYAVERKEFEEASDDYNPPIQSFKTITSF